MKKYRTDNLTKLKQRKQSKRGVLRRRVGLFFLMCSGIVMLLIVAFFGRTDPNNTVNRSYWFSIDENKEPVTDILNILNKYTENDGSEKEWCLILVNKWNRIPDDYKVELTELSNGESIDKRINPALQEMLGSAQNDKIYPIVVSGYRTPEIQQSLMDEKIEAYKAESYSLNKAKVKVEEWVAPPSTSEHQIGLSVDINADGINSAGYEVYEWLDKNVHKFGFICRYPADKTKITGVINEPWHYRYVGVEAATEIKNQGICLEEYLDRVS